MGSQASAAVVDGHSSLEGIRVRTTKEDPVADALADCFTFLLRKLEASAANTIGDASSGIMPHDSSRLHESLADDGASHSRELTLVTKEQEAGCAVLVTLTQP